MAVLYFNQWLRGNRGIPTGGVWPMAIETQLAELSQFFPLLFFYFLSLKPKQTNKEGKKEKKKRTSWQGDQRKQRWSTLHVLQRASKLLPFLCCHPMWVAFVLMAASWLPLLWLQRDNGKSLHHQNKNVLGMGQNSESLLQGRLESKNIFQLYWVTQDLSGGKEVMNN